MLNKSGIIGQAETLITTKAQAIARFGMTHLLSAKLPLFIVNEYPKSGGSWVSQMLGSALGVPFPRNQFPLPKRSIVHAHYLNPRNIRNVTVVWRDGRDVAISWYHHCLFPHEISNTLLLNQVRKDLAFQDYEDVSKNLPTFIRYMFTKQRYPRFSWADFVRSWHSRNNVVYVRYEELRRNTVSELQRVVLELAGEDLGPEEASAVVEEFSFARQSGRQPGEENKRSFLRKAVVGDWRNYFSPEAREVFDQYAGDELILLGYEKDRAWVGAK